MGTSVSESTTFSAVYEHSALSLTVDPGSNGSVATDPSGSYDFGTRFNLLDPTVISISSAAGYYHIGYTNDIDGNPVDLDSFTLTADTAITAVYAAKLTGSLTIATNPVDGTIDGSNNLVLTAQYTETLYQVLLKRCLDLHFPVLEP